MGGSDTMSQDTIRISALDNADHAEISRSVEAICDGFPARYWRDLEDAAPEESYPEAFVLTMEEAGFLGPLIPEAHGGIDLPLSATARIVQTIHARGCSGAVFVAQCRLAELLARFGSDRQKQEVLPRIAAGELRLQSLAVSEGGAGDDLARIETSARRTDAGWVVNGRKRWVHFAGNTNLMLLAARTGDGAGQVSLFLVDMDRHRGDAVRVEPIRTMNNVCGSEVVLQDLELASDSLVGDLHGAAACLEGVRALEAILVAASACGDSRFFSSKGIEYAKERVVFGNPIGKYQGIQFPLARTYVEGQGCELLLDLAIALYEAGQDCRGEAIMVQHMATQAAWETADAAFTTHGGFAFAREYDIERKWREVRAMRNAAAPALPYVAENVLGLRL